LKGSKIIAAKFITRKGIGPSLEKKKRTQKLSNCTVPKVNRPELQQKELHTDTADKTKTQLRELLATKKSPATTTINTSCETTTDRSKQES